MQSLEKILLAWISGALAVGGLLVAGALYIVMLSQMNESFDDDLHNIASAVAAFNHKESRLAGPPATHSGPILSPDDEADVVTAAWTADRERFYTSDSRVSLPFSAVEGLSYPRVSGEPWVVYTAVHEGGSVQAAQRQAARGNFAARSALNLAIPMLVLAAVVCSIFLLALRRGLRPLDVAAKEIGKRSVSALTPISVRAVPREIAPLVESMNELIGRLSASFSTQRRFMADAAHELRTPVTALRLQLSLLRDAQSDIEREAATVGLEAGVDRTRKLVEQLLQVSRSEFGGQPLAVERVDLSELCRHCVADMHATAVAAGVDLGVAQGQ